MPAVVTLDGVGDVTPDLTAQEVKRRWHIDAPLLDVGGGSNRWAALPVCAGAMHGVAMFTGGAGASSNFDASSRLLWVTFDSGAMTDRHVGIGSTLRALRNAYGSELVRAGGGLEVRGVPRRSEGSLPNPVRPAIVFLLAGDTGRNKTVYSVSYGRLGEMEAYYVNRTPSVSC